MYERGLGVRVVGALLVEHVLGRQPLPKSRGAASAPHPPSPWQGEGEGAFERCALRAARPPSLAFSQAPSRSVNPRRAGSGWGWGTTYLGARVGVSKARFFASSWVRRSSRHTSALVVSRTSLGTCRPLPRVPVAVSCLAAPAGAATAVLRSSPARANSGGEHANKLKKPPNLSLLPRRFVVTGCGGDVFDREPFPEKLSAPPGP